MMLQVHSARVLSAAATLVVAAAGGVCLSLTPTQGLPHLSPAHNEAALMC